jgi:predicted porin
MQKKLIALAVAGAAAGFASAPVLAQSSVSVYGVIDQAITSSNGDGGNGSVTSLNGSGYTTERLGFKGSEDLGNGMKANFMLETGFNSANGYHDTASYQLFQRQAKVGLSGASWGAVNFGRQYTPVFSIQAMNDIFRVAGIGTIYSLTNTGVTRQSNSIRYDSPNMSGFTMAAMYSMGDTGGGSVSGVDPKNQGRHAGLNVKYANGPLALGLGYGEQKAPFGVMGNAIVVPDPVTGNVDTGKTTALAGSYNFQVAKVNAGWQNFKLAVGGTDVKVDVWNVGVDVPVFGADHVKLVYAKSLNKTSGVNNADADLVSLGYVHPMSKRTTLYATYARMSNETNAMYGLSGGAQKPSVAGNDPSGFQVGLSHNF